MQEFLNWRTDPLLVDSEPKKQNAWLTANELIEANKRDSFITLTGQFLLYPVMVRRIDFISGERILQSFPYILLDKEWCDSIRKQSLSLAEKAHNYFSGANYNRSIRVWQKKIITYLEEQQRLPFPLFRFSDNWLDYFNEKKFARFQSARGENFQLQLYLTDDLAYLTGVIIGDGHLAEYFVNIIDSSKEHIINLVKMLEEIFNSRTEFFKQKNANAWNVNILGKWIVRFFNFLSGQPIAARKYPALREPLIFQNNNLYRNNFWAGLMDADGSYRSTISFASASKKLRNDFSRYLNKKNIQHRFYEHTAFGSTTFSLNITGESRKQFASLIGSSHPKKQQELQRLLERKIRKFSQRSQTLLQQGEWSGQIQGFNKSAIFEGYFDFSLIPTLQICNLGNYIKSLRKMHNQKQNELSSYLAIPSSLLSRYELNKSALPIHILLKIISYYNCSHKEFFSQFRRLTFRSSKSSCQFPTQPDNILLTILQGLQIKSKDYFLIIGLLDKSIEQYKKEISDYFLINKQKNRVFQNTCLIKIIQAYCLIQNRCMF